MEYAVIETGGKQYRIKPGDVIEIDRLDSSSEALYFEKVLLHVTDSEVNIGKPYIENLRISAKILEQVKGPKLRVARFTAKSRHRRVIGFRPLITRVQIERIVTTASTTPKTTKVKPKK